MIYASSTIYIDSARTVINHLVLPSELHIHGINVWLQSDVLQGNIVLSTLITEGLPWHNSRQLLVRRSKLDRVRVVAGWLNEDRAARGERASIDETFIVERLQREVYSYYIISSLSSALTLA